MQSEFVVISWWSNCLALACLHNLLYYTCLRKIYVVQVGKPRKQMERFREYLPPSVVELPYAPGLPAEDWRVRERVARTLLADREGLWFIDHDMFLLESAEEWLQDMDRRLGESRVCLCRAAGRSPSITRPAFWLSPVRFPPDTPGFARLPFREEPVAKRPYALRQHGELKTPEKDTLVAAMEFWQERDLVWSFPVNRREQVTGEIAPFPRFEHIGGLYTLTNESVHQSSRDWVARSLKRFGAFYDACPPEWLATEDPVLLERLAEFRQAASPTTELGH